MADLEENERYCHDLLVQLKKTTECLLAANSVQGVWSTYGGLRRVCLDAEAILCHRIKRSRASSESDGSFWQFVQGLKWLSPSLAPVIDKMNRHTQSRKLGGAEMGRAWLRESVQDHTLMSQLDILISDQGHLQNFYHDDAFLRQPDCVKAMRIFFKAIELGKPALLSEISPNLLRLGPASVYIPRRSSVPVGRAVRPTGASQQVPEGCYHSSTGNSQISTMGNKHAHLNVTYSNQLSNSNLSLAVDPSLGASSLLHQKALSDPYFVSSLDSPRALDSFARDPFSEAVRNQLHNSQLQNFQQNSQSAFGHSTQSAFGHPSQSAFGHPSQSAFGHPSQSAFGHPSQSAFGHPSQSAFGHPSQSAFDQLTQSAFDHFSQSSFENSVQSSFEHPSEISSERSFQSSFEHPSEISLASDNRSVLESSSQSYTIQGNRQPCDLTIDNSATTNSGINDVQSKYPPTIVVSPADSPAVPEARARTSSGHEEHTMIQYSAPLINAETSFLAGCRDVETDFTCASSLASTELNNVSGKQQKYESVDASTNPQSDLANEGVDTCQIIVLDEVGLRLPSSDDYAKFNLIYHDKEIEILSQNFQPHENRTIEVQISKEDVLSIIDVSDAVPASNLVEAVPITNLVETVPEPNLVKAVPTTNLVKAVPTTNLVEAVPTTNLVEAVPTTNLVEAVPEPNLVKAVPTTNPVEAVPTTNLVKAVPTTNLVKAVPITNLVKAVPTTNLVKAVPITNLVEAVPTTNLVEAVPTTNPLEAVSATSLVEAVPTTNPVEAVSATSLVEAVPTTNPVEAVPTTNPIEAVPTTNPVEAVPTTNPVEAVPILSLVVAATGSQAPANCSENSNRAFDRTGIRATNPPTNHHNVPVSSSKAEIRINILPETPTLPRNYSFTSGISNLMHRETGADNLQPKITSVRSDPGINITHPLTSLGDNEFQPNYQLSNSDPQVSDQQSPVRPWSDVDLYQDYTDSPCSSPISKTFSGALRSSGNVYIPLPIHPGVSSLGSGGSQTGTLSKPSTSNHQQSAAVPPRKLGHKRWVSDTSTIRVDQLHQAEVLVSQTSSSKNPSEQKTEVSKQNGAPRRRASEFEPPLYQGNLTKPTEGQSLMSYLTSQDFNTCANLEKENAHFRICEALIEAFESMKFTRAMKRQETGKSRSSSDSSSDEEIQELRQRIRIRKRERMMAKVRSFPSLSDDQTDTATNSQTASSPVSSKNDFSSMSGDSDSDEGGNNERNIDLTMSSDNHGNLTVIRSSGLNLSMASLYSDAELQRSNQQIERNTSNDESTTAGSAESIAISLLRKFSEKHLPKASELKWLVSECDAPQRLLPLPLSTPVSPDDAENADLSTNRTRLRGNMEWAPPRAQIIFSIHPTEKRAVLMRRQNFRCAGCGMRVDPAFMKRYRYCVYLGKYFCQCCHTGETSIIPGRVIEKWDFSRYPIANFSYSLLEKMWREPLFHLNTINPALYKRVRGLENIRECRQQLNYLHSLLAICKRDAVLLKEMSKMPSHWISNDDAYSMEDFTQVRNWTMLNHIKSFIAVAVIHVNDCQLCQGLGFICGMCQDQQVIFPFQLENVIKCPVCQACYHKDCFIPGKCPKCIRLEARRKLQQEPLSPDSPESAESDDTQSASQNVTADGSPL